MHTLLSTYYSFLLVWDPLPLCRHRAPCATPLRPVACASHGSAALAFMPWASRRGHRILALSKYPPIAMPKTTHPIAQMVPLLQSRLFSLPVAWSDGVCFSPSVSVSV
jgi:hypothetical protein